MEVLNADAPAVAALYMQRLADAKTLSESFHSLMLRAVLLRAVGLVATIVLPLAVVLLLWLAAPLEALQYLLSLVGIAQSPYAGAGAGGSLSWGLAVPALIALQLVSLLARGVLLKVHQPRFGLLIALGQQLVHPSKLAFHVVQFFVSAFTAGIILQTTGSGNLVKHNCNAAAGSSAYPRQCLNTSTAVAVIAATVVSVTATARCLCLVRRARCDPRPCSLPLHAPTVR